MKLTIKIQMDNAAFAEDGNDGRSEAARILEIVARRLNDGIDSAGRLVGHNGNVVGDWKIVGGAGEHGNEESTGSKQERAPMPNSTTAYTCKACGCPIDHNGCGCNPHDA